MGWFELIMALISYFGAKKSGPSNTTALAAAGIGAAGAYYVENNTDWGKSLATKVNGLFTSGSTPALGKDNLPLKDAAGNVVMTNGTNAFDVLKGWGATGTAAVIGTAGVVAAGPDGLKKWIPWIIGGLIAYKVFAG